MHRICSLLTPACNAYQGQENPYSSGLWGYRGDQSRFLDSGTLRASRSTVAYEFCKKQPCAGICNQARRPEKTTFSDANEYSPDRMAHMPLSPPDAGTMAKKEFHCPKGMVATNASLNAHQIASPKSRLLLDSQSPHGKIRRAMEDVDASKICLSAFHK